MEHTNRLRVFIWAINTSRSFMADTCGKMLRSAEVHDVRVEPLGVGREFVSHTQRMELLRDALEAMEEQELSRTIVVAMDGSDTLFNGPGDAITGRFMQMNTRILIAAEKTYSYQYQEFQKRFDDIGTPYPYRYVNAGAFMGYGDSLLNLMRDMLRMKSTFWPHANDQGLLGIWVYLNMRNERLMRMDLNCSVFWVACNDWDHLMEASLSGKKRIRNTLTGTVPPIIHLTCLGSSRVAGIYDIAYRSIVSP